MPAEFEAVLRVGEAAMELARAVEEDLEYQPNKAQFNLAELRNLELEGDLIDRADKLVYCRDKKIPELQEENRYLRGRIESLSTADLQILACESQLAEGREEGEKSTKLEEQQAEVLEEETRVCAEAEALKAKVAELEVDQREAEEEKKNAALFGFERCKGLVVVLAPEVDLDLLQPEHKAYEGRVVKPKEGQPLEEAEVLLEFEEEEEPEDESS